MQGEGGEGVGWSDSCAAEGKSNFRRWSCRAGRGAESQQQPAVAHSCKAFCLLFVFVGAMQGEGLKGVASRFLFENYSVLTTLHYGFYFCF